MTPKEKAQELFNKYFAVAESIEWSSEETALKAEKLNDELGDDVLIYWHELAKQSALIAVDEILNLGLHSVGDYRNDQATIDDFSTVTWYINYWQEVKQEIEQL